MTSVEFRVALALVAVLIAAQIAYRAPRSATVRASGDAAQFGWLRALSAKRRCMFAAVAISLVTCALYGLIGMFFFSKIAAAAFLIATVIGEVANRMLFQGARQSPLESALSWLTTGGSLLILYLVFVGPARHLFK